MQLERLQNPDQFPLGLRVSTFAIAKSNNSINYISLGGPEIPPCMENIIDGVLQIQEISPF